MQRRKKIKVLICNEHNLFREGIKALFPEGTAIEIVGEATTAGQALSQMKQLRPDVVLLDANTSDLAGSEATRRIKAINPRVEILILSLCDDEPLISECLGAGAAGFIRKEDGPLQLERAIGTAYNRRVQHAA
jgi:DNA-binding NarL/FixJ family response regulator